MGELEFQVLVDTSLLQFCSDFLSTPSQNKFVLSLLNDYEDGKWRFKKFQDFIWDNIAESCLSVNERNSLVNQSLLTEAAKKLRLTDKEKDSTRGSEIAEIVLYALMKKHFGALPVVPKIFYKQNSQDNAKGADSVHIVLEEDSDFTIWFGEAKFYNSIADARLAEIVKSVGNLLETEKLKKENSIITNVSDLEQLVQNETTRSRIHDLLNTRTSIDELKVRLNVPILLLHECEQTKAATMISEQYRKALIETHSQRANAYFKKQIETLAGVHLYSEIKFHLILFPVPEKTSIVNRFLKNADHYKNQ